MRIHNQSNKWAMSIFVVVLMTISALFPMVSVASAGSNNPNPVGTGPNLVISTTHTVAGFETYNNIIITGTGSLVVPVGATFDATNIVLQADSSVEVNGGNITLTNPVDSGSVAFIGYCSNFEVKNGGVIFMRGSDGAFSQPSSHGGLAEFNVTATNIMEIGNSTIGIYGGDGYDLPPSTNAVSNAWTTGGILSGIVAAGGKAELYAGCQNLANALIIDNSILNVEGGDGGDASDGGSGNNGHGKGGGYNNGGDVSGDVGSGGNSISFFASDYKLQVTDTDIFAQGGNGGKAGNGGHGYGQNGAGGGGYSGGDAIMYYGLPGGDVSGNVGRGGSTTLALDSADTIIMLNTNSFLSGGNGGDAGDGGHGGYACGGGGGGYGGGGGAENTFGSAPASTGGDGGIISDWVGSGGTSLFNINSQLSIMAMCSVSVSGGNGGQAGDGGDGDTPYDPYTGGEGGGGGGYGGGGGAGHDTGAGIGGDTVVQDYVGCGGSSSIILEGNKFASVVNSFTATGGNGGDGGTGGTGDESGGGGGYGGAGGSCSNSAIGGQCTLTGFVGDGGAATLDIQASLPSITESTFIQATGGLGGTAPTSPGQGFDGGEGEGRTTANGIPTTTIPMSIPLLISPQNNSLAPAVTTFEWFDMHDSTTNGNLVDYALQIDNNMDFSSPEVDILTVNDVYTLGAALSTGTYYWRVMARYASPANSNLGWSEVWSFANMDGADLTMLPGGIVFDPSSPVPNGMLFYINASIWNVGNLDSSMADVYFFNENPDVNGDNILDVGVTEIGVDSVNVLVNSTSIASISWMPLIPGAMIIYAWIDPYGLSSDVIPGNNLKSSPIMIRNFDVDITNIIQTPQNPNGFTNIDVTGDIIDPDGIASAFVYYSTNGGATWPSVPMAFMGGSQWMGTIPPVGTGVPSVSYYIWAQDNFGVTNTSGIITFALDTEPPTFDIPAIDPQYPGPTIPVNVSIPIMDNVGVTNGTLWYSFDNQSTWNSAPMTGVGGPTGILFEDDFESGSPGWVGTGGTSNFDESNIQVINFLAGNPQPTTHSFTVTSPATGNGMIYLDARNGDFNSLTEYIDVWAENLVGTYIGRGQIGFQNALTWQPVPTHSWVVTAAQINTWASNGVIDIMCDYGAEVDNLGGSNEVRIRLTYPSASTPWESGTPANGNIVGAHSGSTAWGTDLDANYMSGSNSNLISPPFDLSTGSTNEKLSFWHTHDFYNTEAGGIVEVSTDNSTWTKIDPVTGDTWYSACNAFSGGDAFTGDTYRDWYQSTYDLSPFSGNSDVRVRFNFKSTSAVTQNEGWYIDDVKVTSGMWYGTIPAAGSGVPIVYYYVNASDAAANFNNSAIYNYSIDYISPVIVDVSSVPDPLNALVPAMVFTNITDNLGLGNIFLWYSYNGVTWASQPMSYLSGNIVNAMYGAAIPAAGIETTVYYYVSAFDIYNNNAISATQTYNTNLAPIIANIVHSPLNPSGISTVNVTADITDINGVASAFLYYSINGGVTWLNIPMTNSVGDEYYGVIPAIGITLTVFYYIEATDTLTTTGTSATYSYDINADPPTFGIPATSPQYPNATSPVDVTISISDDTGVANGTLWYSMDDQATWSSVAMVGTSGGVGTIFEDDMEYGSAGGGGQPLNGWTHGGAMDEWQHGLPTYGPGTAYSGSYCWGTDLDNTYANYADFWLQSPLIDLSGVTSANLTFYDWLRIEGYTYDHAYVEISSNGLTWNQLDRIPATSVPASSGYNYWKQHNYDISAYAGDPSVWVRFRVDTDISVIYEGWYIDDFCIETENQWIGTIPAAGLGVSEVYYYVSAADLIGNQGNSPTYSYIIDSIPPDILDVTSIPDPSDATISCPVFTNISDYGEIDNVDLWYSFDGVSWSSLPMAMQSGNLTDAMFLATIPPSNMVTTVLYYVSASDLSGNSNVSVTQSYETGYPPVIANVIYTPLNPGGSTNVNVTADITDFDGIQAAFIYYSIDGGATWLNMPMTNGVGDEYYGFIPATGISLTVLFYVGATDNQGVSSTSPQYSYYVDADPPVFGIPSIDPTSPNATNPVDVSINITDASGVANATLWYSMDMMMTWNSAPMSGGQNSAIIFEEHFPSMTLDASNWASMVNSPVINAIGSNEPSAPYSLNMDGADDILTSVVMDLSTYTDANISFYYEMGGGGEAPDANDFLFLDYLTSSNAWVNLWQVPGASILQNTYTYVINSLPANAMHSNFQFRFRSIGTAATIDDFFVDDIIIDGSGDSAWVGTIPASGPGVSMVFYNINAVDVAGNWDISPFYVYSIDQNPMVIDLSSVPSPSSAIDSPVIFANISDDFGIGSVALWYSFDGGLNWNSQPMAFISGSATNAVYASAIPPAYIETTVSYYIKVFDTGGSNDISPTLSYVTNYPPFITDIDHSPQSPNGVQDVTITANVTDSNGIGAVTLYYSIDNGATWITVPMIFASGNEFYYIIPALGIDINVPYMIEAIDTLGFITQTPVYNFTVDCTAPMADAGADLQITQGTNQSLDGSGSTDNFAIDSYVWTFTDNGIPITLYNVNPIYLFDNIGNILVTLNVSDASGNWDTDTLWVNVTDGYDPVSNAGNGWLGWFTTTTFNVPYSATDNYDLGNIMFYYRYSSDNATWTGWIFFGSTPVSGTAANGNFLFTSPNGEGYYQFYSVAIDDTGNVEDVPLTTDSEAGYDGIPPIADAGSDQQIIQGVNLLLDGSGSSDTTGIANYTWTFMDAGPVTLYGSNPSYTFNNIDNILITLTVMDGVGNSDTDTIWVNVTDGYDPISSAGSGWLGWFTTAPFNVPYSATDNYGLSNINLYYRFSTDNIAWGGWALSQSIAVSGTSASGNYAFGCPNGQGYYQFYTIATDDAGNVEISPLSRDSEAGFDNVSPIANAGANMVGPQSLFVIFDGSGSLDNIGIDNYTWTFTDGGAVTLYGENPSYTFNDISNVMVTLTVTDGMGNSDMDTMWVYVTDGYRPVSNAGNGWLGWFITSSYNVPYSASDNYELSNINLYYRYSANNVTWGGWTPFQSIAIFGTSASGNYAFGCPNGQGYYQFYTIATDSAGNVETSPFTMDSNAGYDSVSPIANAGSDKAGPQSLFVQFDGSGSIDVIGIVNYTWTFTDGGIVRLYGVNPSYTFNNVGNIQVTLTVRDGVGSSDTDTMWVNVTDGIEPVSNAGSGWLGWFTSSPFNVPYLATDNYELSNIDLYYRSSVDNVTWGGWAMFQTLAISGTSANGNFAFTCPDGERYYQFHTVAIDDAGNYENATASKDSDAGYDGTRPVITSIIMSPNSPLNTGTVTFTITFSKSMNQGLQPIVTMGTASPYDDIVISGYWTSMTIWEGNFEILESTTNGRYTLIVSGAEDMVGNIVVPDFLDNFIIDTTAPISQMWDLNTYQTSRTFTLDLDAQDDDGSGISIMKLCYRVDGGAWRLYNTYSSASISISFTAPSDGLYEFYTMATDHAGNEEAMRTDFVQTIVDTITPYVESNAPTGIDVSVTPSIELVFNEPMNKQSIENGFELTDGTNTWTLFSGNAIWSYSNSILLFMPTPALEYNTSYIISIPTSASDIAGNALGGYGWGFITIEGDQQITPVDDTDTDGDGILDIDDPDDDNDRVDDVDDDFPLDPSEDTDTDRDGTGNNEDDDDDNDDMPDTWEEENDLDPLNSNDDDDDDDGDGFTNLEEYEEGTDPQDPDSSPASTSSFNDFLLKYWWVLLLFLLVVLAIILLVSRDRDEDEPQRPMITPAPAIMPQPAPRVQTPIQPQAPPTPPAEVPVPQAEPVPTAQAQIPIQPGELPPPPPPGMPPATPPPEMSAAVPPVVAPVAEPAPIPEATPQPEPEVSAKPKLSDEEMIAKIDKAFADGKISEESYTKNMKKFIK